MVIVDSSVWIDYFAAVGNRQTDWLEAKLEERPIGLVDLILCEVLQGIEDDFTFARVQHELTSLEVFPAGGMELAVSAARTYRQLRGHGVTVRKTVDCLIATFCMENGHELLHRDRDFDVFERHLGLRVVRE